MKLLILILFLAATVSAQQIVLVGGCASTGTSCSPTVQGGQTFAGGQFEYVFAYRSATMPRFPSGFITLNTASVSSSSFRSGCQVTSSNSPASGTWTNATLVIVQIYSGVASDHTASCKTLGTGGRTTAGTSGTTSTYTFTGVTLTNGTGTSWIVAAVGSSAAVCTPATVLHSEYTTTNAIGHDTNGGVSSFSTLTCMGTTGNWKLDTVQLLAKTPTFTSVNGVTVGGLRGQLAKVNGTPIGAEVVGLISAMDFWPLSSGKPSMRHGINQVEKAASRRRIALICGTKYRVPLRQSPPPQRAGPASPSLMLSR